MTSGYNVGMRASDAKYKIYLHQDLFIINQNFLYEILYQFTDKSVGMIGMVGSPSLSSDYILWNGTRYGAYYRTSVASFDSQCVYPSTQYDSYEVEAIDGMLMATQYDIPWREDLFKHWDYYDISQSFEFRNRGYKVTVPRMSPPWVIHDSGALNFRHFYEERIVFINNYIKKN